MASKLLQAYFSTGKFGFIKLHSTNNNAFIQTNKVSDDRVKLADKLKKAQEKDTTGKEIVGIVDFGIGQIVLYKIEEGQKSGEYGQIIWSSRSYSKGTYETY